MRCFVPEARHFSSCMDDCPCSCFQMSFDGPSLTCFPASGYIGFQKLLSQPFQSKT